MLITYHFVRLHEEEFLEETFDNNQLIKVKFYLEEKNTSKQCFAVEVFFQKRF